MDQLEELFRLDAELFHARQQSGPINTYARCGSVSATDSAFGFPQNTHDLEEIHVAFVRIYLGKVMQTSADVAHVDLIDLPAITKVLDDREDFRSGILQAFTGGSQT